MNATLKYWLREIGIVVVSALVIFILLQTTLMKAEVIGESMEPNLYRGEQVLINKMAYNFGTPERGDIIVFDPPEETRATNNYIKRVIGLPGEIITIKEGEVIITHPDGSTATLDEPYIAELPLYNYESQVIPAGHYFVMGDNRNNSSDSRGGWTVPLESIVGKAWFSFWPFDEFGAAPNYSFSD